MKTLIAPCLSLLLLASGASAKTLNVMATTSDLASIVKEIGKDRVSVAAVVVGARDPHRIEAKPSYMSRAAQADMWVSIGLELELAYEQPILQGSANRKIQPGSAGYVAVGNWCPIVGKPTGNVTRAQGDLHPFGNPHVWLDPYNVRIIAQKLADKMASIDKANAKFFEANASDFVAKLDASMFGANLVSKVSPETLWKWSTDNDLESNVRAKSLSLGGWAAKMAPLRGVSIVTYHRSWSYFVNRFNLKVAAELEPKPGIDPTPGHIASVIRTVQSSGAKILLQEPFYSPRNANFVASRTSAKVVIAPGSVGHTSKANSIIALFDELVDQISAAAR